jgi:hypothetical protein
MADSNRLRLAYVEETTLGTTPGSPAMRTIRATGESLNHDIQTTESKEIRSDRQTADLMQVGAANSGALNFELSFPAVRTWLADFLRYALFASSWSSQPETYNATADSSITDAGTAADTYAVASGGTAYKAAHLVRASGFTNAANNQLFRVASSTGTTVVGSSLSLTAETAPPSGARLKVVGFEGASGDIQATSTGLASTALDFTTLGLVAGQWLKIGGATAGQAFGTLANNDWARIVSVAAQAIQLDHRPSGWATDNGSGKTLRVFFGDVLRNGTTKRGVTLEKGFLDLATPEYLAYRGMVIAQMSLQVGSKEVVTGSFSFMGLSHAASTTQLGTPEAVGTAGVMTASANVGRIAEGGAALGTPNFVKSVSVELQNNLREIDAVGTLGLVDVGVGKLGLTGKMSTYFGSTALYQKYLGGTETSLVLRLQKNAQAIVVTLPRIKFEKGTVTAQGENQDVMAELDFRALRDASTDSTIQIDRVEEFA